MYMHVNAATAQAYRAFQSKIVTARVGGSPEPEMS